MTVPGRFEPLEGASPETLNRVKDEVAFFMDKTHQVSFGYVGVLVALAAATKLDVGDAVAKDLGLGLGPLVCVAILTINAVYLSLTAGTLFAVVKRGMFLVLRDHSHGGHRSWESFLRAKPAQAGMPSKVGWNLDNYYMIPLVVLIFVISGIAVFIGLKDAAGTGDWVAVGVGAIIQLIPILMFIEAIRLADAVTRSIRRVTGRSAKRTERA
jgi:hypothetical protein